MFFVLVIIKTSRTKNVYKFRGDFENPFRFVEISPGLFEGFFDELYELFGDFEEVPDGVF